MGKAVRHRQLNLPKQEGELARLRVISGPEQGSLFVLQGLPVTLGRAEDCDVPLSDLKASRKHVQMGIVEQGKWRIKDLGSANGILLNGKNTRLSALKARDVIQVGETVLEFLPSDVNPALLSARPRSLSEISEDQQKLAAHVSEVRAMGGAWAPGGGKKPGVSGSRARSQLSLKEIIQQGAWDQLPQEARWIALAALAGVAYLVAPWIQQQFQEPQETNKKARPVVAAGGITPPSTDPEVRKRASIFFRTGFREFREGSYLRAKKSFENALQVDPGHRLAREYLDQSQREVREIIRKHLIEGKKSLALGRVRQAKGHFDSVQRILYLDDQNPDFVEAKKLSEEVTRLLVRQVDREAGGEAIANAPTERAEERRPAANGGTEGAP